MTKQNKQKPNKTKETLQMVFQAIFSIDLPSGQLLSKEGMLLIALHFLRKKKKNPDLQVICPSSCKREWKFGKETP